MAQPTIRVALVGAGTVGGAVAATLLDPRERDAIAAAAGAQLDLIGVAVRDAGRERPGVPRALVVTDAASLTSRDDVDVVVELAGGVAGIEPIVAGALSRSVPVVTANKALMAHRGSALLDLAAAQRTDLFFEGAVAGGVPIVRALRTSLSAEPIERVLGIVNGTTNYILSKMADETCSFADALADAQALGFAEADPGADVGGVDAAAKVAILSALAFGTALAGEQIHTEGITSVTPEDVEFARRHGHVIKLLGVAERVGVRAVSRRVHPVMVPRDHPLASVSGATNAVFVEGARSGPLMWLGAGAGGAATASAVIGDIVAAARNRVDGRYDRVVARPAPDLLPLGEIQSVFYLSLDVLDRPGVLASVAGIFGDHGVSIKSMEQSGFGDEARLMFLTHLGFEVDVAATIEDLATLEVVDRVGSCIRVLGTGDG